MSGEEINLQETPAHPCGCPCEACREADQARHEREQQAQRERFYTEAAQVAASIPVDTLQGRDERREILDEISTRMAQEFRELREQQAKLEVDRAEVAEACERIDNERDRLREERNKLAQAEIDCARKWEIANQICDRERKLEEERDAFEQERAESTLVVKSTDKPTIEALAAVFRRGVVAGYDEASPAHCACFTCGLKRSQAIDRLVDTYAEAQARIREAEERRAREAFQEDARSEEERTQRSEQAALDQVARDAQA